MKQFTRPWLALCVDAGRSEDNHPEHRGQLGAIVVLNRPRWGLGEKGGGHDLSKTAAIAEVALEQCPFCGYSLEGLPVEHRCPECGRSVDLR